MESTFGIFGQSISLLETFAAFTGALGVLLTVRKSSWCFPVGMINVALYLWLFLQPQVRLLADAVLQIFFFLLLAYGWFHWKRDGAAKSFRPERMKSGPWRVMLAVVSTGAVVIGGALHHFTDASLPWLDALLTSASLGAQWMVAHRKLENWWMWIGVNCVYIPLFLYKELPLTAALYAVYLVLAVAGLRSWKRELQSQKPS
jgi:nicotinamide mononucleotide transporter